MVSALTGIKYWTMFENLLVCYSIIILISRRRFNLCNMSITAIGFILLRGAYPHPAASQQQLPSQGGISFADDIFSCGNLIYHECFDFIRSYGAEAR
jgi:hypothetical protein